MPFKSFVLAAALAVAPLIAQAATIVYQATGDAFYDRIDAANAFADFFDDGSDETDIAVSGALTDSVVSGDLFVSDFGLDGVLLSSSSVVSVATAPGAVGFRTLTAIFDGLTGRDAALFGQFATAIFTSAVGDEADGALAPVDVAILSDVAPVPIPASLPLLLAGIGGFAVLRRKRI